jgi:hypothetical protein
VEGAGEAEGLVCDFGFVSRVGAEEEVGIAGRFGSVSFDVEGIGIGSRGTAGVGGLF